MVKYLVSSDCIVLEGEIRENDEAAKACCQWEDVANMNSFSLEEP